jgi:hypothetical protein
MHLDTFKKGNNFYIFWKAEQITKILPTFLNEYTASTTCLRNKYILTGNRTR